MAKSVSYTKKTMEQCVTMNDKQRYRTYFLWSRVFSLATFSSLYDIQTHRSTRRSGIHLRFFVTFSISFSLIRRFIVAMVVQIFVCYLLSSSKFYQGTVKCLFRRSERDNVTARSIHRPLGWLKWVTCQNGEHCGGRDALWMTFGRAAPRRDGLFSRARSAWKMKRRNQFVCCSLRCSVLASFADLWFLTIPKLEMSRRS